MTTRFLIEIKNQAARAASLGRPGGAIGSTAQGAAREARAAEALAKRTAQEIAKTQQAALRQKEQADKMAVRSSERAAAAMAAAAKRAAGEVSKTQISAAAAAAREQDRFEREQLRRARAANREHVQIMREREKAQLATLARIQKGALGFGTSVGFGAVRGAQALGGGVGAAARGISQGGVTGILGSVPRAAGELAKGAGDAAAQFARGFGVGLSKLLPDAMKGVAKTVGNAFAVVGQLAGALGSAAGEIAGFIGDKLGLALQVSMGAAVAVGIAGIHKALAQEDLEVFFEGFAKASGKTAAEALDGLREATRGMVSDLDLLRESNQAYLKDAVATSDEFEKLASLAVDLGKSIGQRPVEALNTLTNAIGTFQSKGAKRMLGAALDFEKAFKQAAASRGVLVDALTDTEKHTIALNHVLDIGAKKLEGLGQPLVNVSDDFDRVKTSVSNTLAAIGKSLLPAFGEVLRAIEPVAKAIGTFFTNNREVIVKNIASAFGSLKDNIGSLPQVIASARLEDLFTAAALAAEKLWIQFRAAASATFDFIKEELNLFGRDLAVFAQENAAIIGFIHGGAAGAAAGLGTQLGAAVADQFGSGPEAFAQETARRRAANREGFTIAPQGEAGQRVRDINRELEGLPFEILLRAAKAQEEAAQKLKESAGATTPSPSGPAAQVGTIGRRGPPIVTVLPPSPVVQGPGVQPGGSFQATQPTGTKGPIDTSQAKAFVDKLIFDALNAGAVGQVIQDLNEIGRNAEKLEGVQEELDDLAEAMRFDDLRDKMTRNAEAMEASLEEQIKAEQAVVDELKSRLDILNEGTRLIREARDAEVAARNEIAEKFRAEADGIVGNFKAAMDAIASRVADAASQLSGAAGFGGAFGGADLEKAIPTKFKRAARKRSRRATRALKRELSQQGAGLGDEDLIAGGAERIFQNVAEKQVLGAEGGAFEAQKALNQAIINLNAATAAKDAAQEALATQTTATVEQIVANEEKALEALETAADSLKTHQEELKKIRDELDGINKALDIAKAGARR